MRQFAWVFVCLMGLTACGGTAPFTPTEYPLRGGLISAIDISGSVAVENAQNSSDPVIVYSHMGSKLSSDLKAITEAMVQQTQKELQKNGRTTATISRKTISLVVTSLVSGYTGSYYWKSRIQFGATLGDGQYLTFTVPHASGFLIQDLNGCIAEGVMTLLNDGRVRSYLAS